MALVTNVCPLGERLVPDHGVVLAGETVVVPDDVAGAVPGPWRVPTQDEAAARGTATDPLQWRVGEAEEDGAEFWQCREPGHGLLAQEDVWQPGTTEPAATRTDSQED